MMVMVFAVAGALVFVAGLLIRLALARREK
jgi:hypothetical protein